MFANIANLNNWRRERGFSKFADVDEAADFGTKLVRKIQIRLFYVHMRAKRGTQII